MSRIDANLFYVSATVATERCMYDQWCKTAGGQNNLDVTQEYSGLGRIQLPKFYWVVLPVYTCEGAPAIFDRAPHLTRDHDGQLSRNPYQR